MASPPATRKRARSRGSASPAMRRRLTAIVFPNGPVLPQPCIRVTEPRPRERLLASVRCLLTPEDPEVVLGRLVPTTNRSVHLVDGDRHIFAQIRGVECDVEAATTTLRLRHTRELSGFLDRLSVVRGSDPGAAPRKRAIPKSVREIAWRRQFGDRGVARCPVCDAREISMFSHEMAHVVAEAHGGPTTAENLVPCCGSCNRSMGTRDLREFQAEHFPRVPPAA